MNEWAICTIKNSNVYYLASVDVKSDKFVWVTSPTAARTFESKGTAEYYAAITQVRRYHIRVI